MSDVNENPGTEETEILHPTPEDVEELVSLRILAMRPSLENLGRFDPVRARQRLVEGFDPETCWIIRQDGRIIALASWKDQGKSIWIKHLYVHPDAQGTGLGGLLLEKAKSEARRAGLPLELEAVKESLANHWYRKQGFMHSGSTEFDHQYIWKPENPDGLLIRPANPRDEVALQDLMESVWHLSRSPERPERPDAAKARKALDSLEEPGSGPTRDPQTQVLAFLPTGHLAGWIAWSASSQEGVQTVVLEDFIIHQAVQGRGIGRRLLAMTESGWLQQGMTQVRVDVDVRNWQGLSFLFRNGYGRVVQWIGDRKLGPENHAFLRLEKQLGSMSE